MFWSTLWHCILVFCIYLHRRLLFDCSRKQGEGSLPHLFLALLVSTQLSASKEILINVTRKQVTLLSHLGQDMIMCLISQLPVCLQPRYLQFNWVNCLFQNFYANPESKAFVKRDGIEMCEGQINSLCLQIKLWLMFFPTSSEQKQKLWAVQSSLPFLKFTSQMQCRKLGESSCTLHVHSTSSQHAKWHVSLP